MSRPLRKKPQRRSKITRPRNPERRAGRTVYVGLRAYDPELCIAVNCKGLNIRAFDFTPEEVHQIIRRALSDAARDFQAREHVRKLSEKTNDPETEMPDVSPRRDVQDRDA